MDFKNLEILLADGGQEFRHVSRAKSKSHEIEIAEIGQYIRRFTRENFEYSTRTFSYSADN